MHATTRILVVLTGCAATATTARANTRADDGLFAFASAHIGLGAPLGALGVEAGVGFWVLQGSVGVGLGLRGVEVAAQVRASLPVGHIGRLPLHLSLGVGGSIGPGINDLDVSLGEGGGADEIVSFGDDTRWVNGEVGLELRITRALAVRVYAGVGVPVSTDCVVEIDHGEEMPCDAEQHAHLASVDPLVGAAASWRFDLSR